MAARLRRGSCEAPRSIVRPARQAAQQPLQRLFQAQPDRQKTAAVQQPAKRMVMRPQINPVYLPQEVAYDGPAKPGTIVIEGKAMDLQLWKSGYFTREPPRLRIATGYDDLYHLTPERVLRNVLRLGYRGPINHYVGMSHYFRLEANSGGFYISLAGGVLNGPCAAWHRDFCERAQALATIMELTGVFDGPPARGRPRVQIRVMRSGTHQRRKYRRQPRQ